jgi:hypothetical protein
MKKVCKIHPKITIPKKARKSQNKPRQNFSRITEASDINVHVQKPNVIDTIVNVIVLVYIASTVIAKIV